MSIEVLFYLILIVVGFTSFGFAIGIHFERRAWVDAANKRKEVFCESDVYRVEKVERRI